MKKKNLSLIIFLVSFIVLVLYGILLTYNYRMSENYNLLFESDTARVIADATEIIANHYRINVHPLFIILVQPFVFLLKGIVMNKTLAIIILSALASSLSVVFIYKTLSLVNSNKKVNLLLSGIYLFSFSNIIFTAGIEIYNFAALFLLILWYYFIKKYKERYTIYSNIILIVLGVLSAGFTITNIIIYLIVLFLLWITKKIKLKNIIIIGIVTLISIVGLNIGQKIIWRSTPLIWKTGFSGEAKSFSKLKIDKTSFKNVIVEDFFNPIISSDISLKVKYGNKYNLDNYILIFKNIDIIRFLILSSFYILLIFLLIRNFSKNKVINIGLLLSLTFNTTLHLIYGNNSPFLYSLHFMYIIILLFGINLISEENNIWKKTSTLLLALLLIIELINNNIIFIKVLNYVNEIINRNYLLAYLGRIKMISIELFAIFIISLLIYAILSIIKRIKMDLKQEKRVVYSLSIGVFLILILLVFISFESANQSLRENRGIDFGSIKVPDKVHYLSKNFKEHYKNEIQQLDEYQNEVNSLKEYYQVDKYSSINWSYYYYFGMANRRKLFYKEDKVIDIDTKEIIYSFEPEEVLLIPNEYMVLIKTNNKDFIKIYEDNLGVHFNKNGKDEIINGTELELDLYSFDNYKYKNTLKTLYGEILFNIKDSVIYPNIIVYNKPWYRDAAITCMVLEKTNNLDLIKDWVSNITEIYDKQNDGISEADNLGELLYILSTQDNRNEELIDKIEKEAYRLAEENENGYYIYGKTDFGDMYLYQNLWYKLGIERVGRYFSFDLDSIPKDGYAKMAWWSDYEVENDSYESSTYFPYLSYAMRHKLGNGPIPINDSLYPMSLEINASQAKYENYKDIDNNMVSLNASPLHSWAASELMLLLMENN